MSDLIDHIFGAVHPGQLPNGRKPKKAKGPKPSLKFKDLRYRVTASIEDRYHHNVRWFYTTTRNVDGYFLCGREVTDPKSGLGFRDSYRALKTRWRAKEWALKQYNKAPQRTGPAYTLPSEIKAKRKAERAG